MAEPSLQIERNLVRKDDNKNSLPMSDLNQCSIHGAFEIIGYDGIVSDSDKTVQDEIRFRMCCLKEKILTDHEFSLDGLAITRPLNSLGKLLEYSYFDGNVHLYVRAAPFPVLSELFRLIALLLQESLLLGLPLRGGIYALPAPQPDMHFIAFPKEKYPDMKGNEVYLGVQEWSGCFIDNTFLNIMKASIECSPLFAASLSEGRIVKYPIPHGRAYKAVCSRRDCHALAWTCDEISDSKIRESFSTFDQKKAFRGLTWNRIVENTVDFRRFCLMQVIS